MRTSLTALALSMLCACAAPANGSAPESASGPAPAPERAALADDANAFVDAGELQAFNIAMEEAFETRLAMEVDMAR
ncbi:MAG: hypothetical protein WEA77_13225 [Hyphomonas sp.]|uniref:hypothetical protein n=1 Tax=Hyphomonas sp. TaxID=87 RepID=UPI0034A04D75